MSAAFARHAQLCQGHDPAGGSSPLREGYDAHDFFATKTQDTLAAGS